MNKELAELLARGLALADDSPTWKAISGLLAHVQSQESLVVADPSLTNAQRHFNAGRLAMVIDLTHMFTKWKHGGGPEVIQPKAA